MRYLAAFLVISAMVIGLFIQENKKASTDLIIKEAISNNYIQESTYHFVENEQLAIGGGRYKLYLHVKEFPNERFIIEDNYSFLDKSEILITFFNLLGKRCPLKIEANFEDKTYLLFKLNKDYQIITDLNKFVENSCF